MIKNQKGQILVLALIVITVLTIGIVALINSSLTFSQNSKYSLVSLEALNLAEAGIDKAVASLNATAGSYNGESETSLGEGSYEVSVISKNSSTKKVTATGYIPNKANFVSRKTVTIQVSKGIGVAFNYGIQVGDGGLTMSNNSIVTGSVYSNSNITMSNNSQITGDVYVAGGVQPNADQQSDCASPNCGDFIFGENVSGNNQLDVAQSFKPSNNNVLNKVSLKLKKFGSPPDLTVRVLGDSTGKPDKTNVITSGTLVASLVTTSYGFVDVVFASPPNLVANTPYWILIATSSDSTNYWAWSEDTTQGYTRGSPLWSPDWQAKTPSWSAIAANLGFKTYMGGVATSITGANGVVIGGGAHANTLNTLTVKGGAYYQLAQNVTAASYHPASADPTAQVMPLSDANIQEWKDTAASLGVHSGDISGCPSTLPAGKYIGSISLSGNCTVTVGTPIWVTNTFSMSSSDILKLNSQYGGGSGAFVVDGAISINNGNSIQGTGTVGSYLMVVSTFDSKDDPSHTPAIVFSNSGNTGIVYSNLGIVQIANNNNLTEVTAWQLSLNNNVVVAYDQGLASAFFSSGSGGSFSAVKGTYQVK